MTDQQFYDIAQQYLKDTYCLAPNDMDLSITSVSNRGNNETPAQYIDYFAAKYGLKKINQISEKQAIEFMKRFK